MLAENQRLGALPDILGRYEVLKAEAERTLDVTLTSASAVSDDQQKRIIDSLNKRFGRLPCPVVPHSAQSEAFIGQRNSNQ